MLLCALLYISKIRLHFLRELGLWGISEAFWQKYPKDFQIPGVKLHFSLLYVQTAMFFCEFAPIFGLFGSFS